MNFAGGMLNTLNKLYPKLIYILFACFCTLCNSCPPPSILVLLCKDKALCNSCPAYLASSKLVLLKDKLFFGTFNCSSLSLKPLHYEGSKNEYLPLTYFLAFTRVVVSFIVLI